ncbi:MAG: hypothetical protein F7C38_05585 [Desulfurococcales archaeon]|nr:hypothetical protein [Desulfurococcales archaeon]
MPQSLEERLAKIEKMLAEVLERLKWLEDKLREDESLGIAGELTAAFNLPAQKAVEYARTIIGLVGGMGRVDEISRAVVEVLVVEGPMSIRGLERAVRRLRGRASRKTLVERIKQLESLGIVSVERKGTRSIVRLRDYGESGKS